MNKIFLFLSCLAFCFVSCSDYNKVVKGDDYKRKFELANEMYEKGDYFRSITLYEQIYTRMPKSGEGELSYYRIGKSYFSEKDYYMAGYYLGAFVQRFPYSAKTEEALFLTAMCSVNNSPTYSLDQKDTEVAINDLQQFINRYPESPLIDSCNHIMDKMRLKIETKDYESVQLYARTENFRAAATTAETFLEDYPRSKHKEEVAYLLVKNSYKLAINSVDDKKKERIEESMERYRTFVAEFPDSEYKRELVHISDELNKELQKL